MLIRHSALTLHSCIYLMACVIGNAISEAFPRISFIDIPPFIERSVNRLKAFNNGMVAFDDPDSKSDLPCTCLS